MADMVKIWKQKDHPDAENGGETTAHTHACWQRHYFLEFIWYEIIIDLSISLKLYGWLDIKI